jgi:hypothetical protein
LFGASVKKVSKKGTVIVDSGINDGFIKKAKVCIFDGDKKVYCGKILKSKKSMSMLRVKKKYLKRIKKGQEVRLMTAENLQNIASAVGATGKSSVRVGYYPSLMGPTTYNFVNYKTDPNNDATTLWESGKGSKTSRMFGFMMAYEMGLSSGNALDIGVYYRSSIDGEAAVEDYYTSDTSQFSTSDTTGSSFGVYTDYELGWLMMGGRVLVPVGLGIDMETITHKTTTGDDNNTVASIEIASVTSTIMTAIIRTGAHYEYAIGPVGIRVGLIVGIPVSGEAKPSGSVTSPEGGAISNQEKDFEQALGHTKTGLSVDLPMSLSYSF